MTDPKYPPDTPADEEPPGRYDEYDDLRAAYLAPRPTASGRSPFQAHLQYIGGLVVEVWSRDFVSLLRQLKAMSAAGRARQSPSR